MVSINTNLSSLIVQQNLTNSTNALNKAIERMTTGFKINHASDNAANYSISTNFDSKISAYDVAMDNAAMGADMLACADDTLSNISNNAQRLRELCVQARNGTYGKQSIDAMKSEAGALISHIVNQYKTAEYNGIQIFDVYSDRLAELQANSTTPATPIGLSSEINPDYDGFIADPKTYTDDEVAGFSKLSEVDPVNDTISSGTYSISSKEELKQLATMVNSKKVTGGKFVLANDIDLGGEEWTAIGDNHTKNNNSRFRGTFDGNGHTISGLKIHKESQDYQGLFGYTTSSSAIKNVGVVGADIKGKQYTGGLVGYAQGTVSNSYATGTVSGTDDVGGLVGYATNSVSNSFATGTVSGTSYVGGLVGYASSTVTNSYATGTVSGTSYVGGLVGRASSVTNSYATGTVSGTGYYVGGLVGYASSTVTNSYATGTVSGNNQVGGLVGCATKSVTNSYATGTVLGTERVGGLVGYAINSVSNSYATGDVSSTGQNNGSSFTGGLIGIIDNRSGSVEFKNNASFGKVSAQYEPGTGSLIGGIVNATSDTPSGTVTLTNIMTNTTDGLDLIGGAYKYASSTYSEIEEPANMENWNSNITTFSTATKLQVGINSDSSSQISTQTNLNIGFIKQLESLDITSSSAIDTVDAFLNAVSSKATEIGAASNRLISTMESISVSMNNMTSSRSTIKDADIAQVSSEYIRHQILQQASATLLATANQSPGIALQLI